MTYFADLDPENRYAFEAALTAAEAVWDVLMPGWREATDDSLVSYWDLTDPGETVVRGYGGDHRYVLALGYDDAVEAGEVR